MFFNISCYIESISEKHINVKIIDIDNLLKFQKNIDTLYKNKKGKIVSNKHNSTIDQFKLKINKKTKFELDKFTYENINNLIGTNVNISGESKYYNFCVVDEFTDEKKYITGYSLICNKIYI